MGPICSQCGKEMVQAGNPLGFKGMEMWRGTVCVSCRTIFCADCRDPLPGACPKCGSPVQPAFFDLVKQIS
jgi:hypothetical protein